MTEFYYSGKSCEAKMYPTTEYQVAAVLKAYGCTAEKSREQRLFLHSALLVSEAGFMNYYMNV